MPKRRMSCKECGSQKTQKRGSRNGKNRYQCMECKVWFVIDHRQKSSPLWIDYIDSLSLREIGRRKGKSFKQIDNLIRKELEQLPESGYITHRYTKHLCYRGVLCMDAKYVRVRGYDTKIPFLYVIDYHSHDLVCGFLCPSENREAFVRLFRLLKEMDYPLHYLICDDVIERCLFPLKQYFPRAKIQLCATHFLRNMRDVMKVAHADTKKDYDPFLKDLKKLLIRRTTLKSKERSIIYLLQAYGMDDYCEMILQRIIQKKEFLFLFCLGNEDIPHTNNLIEVFNSHLEGRLKTIKGFRSFHSASLFLNGWMIRRRTKSFTSCSTKFSHLNGQTSLGYALKDSHIFKKIHQEIYGK